MLVGIQGRWKAPIAYFFTSTLSAATQKELVVHALEEVHSRGFHAVALTIDAHSTNASVCQLLGCCFEVGDLFQTWFVLPECVSRFLTAHQHILGYLVPYNDVEDTVKEIRYNQGYLAMIKYE